MISDLNRCLYHYGSASVLTRWSSVLLQIAYICCFKVKYSQVFMSHPCAQNELSFFTASIFCEAQKAHMIHSEYSQLEFF